MIISQFVSSQISWVHICWAAYGVLKVSTAYLTYVFMDSYKQPIQIGAYLNWHFQLERSQVSTHNVWDKIGTTVWSIRHSFAALKIESFDWFILSTSLSDRFLLLIEFFFWSIFCHQLIFAIDRFLSMASRYWPVLYFHSSIIGTIFAWQRFFQYSRQGEKVEHIIIKLWMQ